MFYKSIDRVGAGLHNNAGDYLIDHVSLVPKNNIGPDGNLGFALRLSSGGSVDVKFKILGISVNNGAGVDGAVVSNPLTEYIDVKAGTTMKTARDIVVNIPAGADHANIFLNMQVIGADGTFQNARARFTIGAAAGPVLTTIDIQNSRVMASDPAIVGAAGVNETWPVALAAVPDAPYLAAELNGGPYMSAAIVDGKLVMNSRGVDTGLLFVNNNASLLDSNAPSNAMPSSFAGYFGMNDLVVQSGGSYMIRPDIAANPDLLALATPNLMPASSHVITAGLDKAHAEFTLPRQPLAGNTITVNGFQFTFGVALGNIAIGADVPGTIQNIVTFLSAQNDPKIKDLIEFSVDVGNANRMVARAKFAGTAGNAITIASAIDDGFGGQENDWANGAGAGAALFDRGTNNANLGAKTMSDYVYFVAQNGLGTFDEILASSLNFVGKDGLIITTSISKYFEYEVTLPIAAEISAAKQGQETDKKLVEKTKQLLDASTKKSQEEIYMEIVKLMQNMQYAHNLVFMLLRQNQQVLDMLLRG
ncbi:MAG UNVERIFIED_CONTAM: hypothetical protein LVQ98_00360 [Rickettsiaceae bacterium]|jgi:hypothetical protein